MVRRINKILKYNILPIKRTSILMIISIKVHMGNTLLLAILKSATWIHLTELSVSIWPILLLCLHKVMYFTSTILFYNKCYSKLIIQNLERNRKKTLWQVKIAIIKEQKLSFTWVIYSQGVYCRILNRKLGKTHQQYWINICLTR